MATASKRDGAGCHWCGHCKQRAKSNHGVDCGPLYACVWLEEEEEFYRLRLALLDGSWLELCGAAARMPRGLPWTEAGSQVQGPVAL